MVCFFLFQFLFYFLCFFFHFCVDSIIFAWSYKSSDDVHKVSVCTWLKIYRDLLHHSKLSFKELNKIPLVTQFNKMAMLKHIYLFESCRRNPQFVLNFCLVYISAHNSAPLDCKYCLLSTLSTTPYCECSPPCTLPSPESEARSEK